MGNVETAVLCRTCSWFGVYREEVTDRIRGCPICGNPDLTVRDVGDEDWAALGRRLIDGLSDEESGYGNR